MSGGNVYNWTFLDDCEANTSQYRGVNSPLKYFVLDLVDTEGEITYKTLMEETGMPKSYAADRLVKYARRGLLSRSRDTPAAISTYRLTQHGYERLRWFRRQ